MLAKIGESLYGAPMRKPSGHFPNGLTRDEKARENPLYAVMFRPDFASSAPIPWLLAAAVLIGMGLRLYHLGHLSLWFDEGLTFFYTSMPLKALWTTPMDPHPPSFYSIIKAFIIFGQSEFALRLLSALAGTATIPVVYCIGRIFGGHKFGFAAAAALALSGIHIEYSQEARSYALVTFFFSLACLFSLRFITRRQQAAIPATLDIDIILYGLFAGLAVVTHVVMIYYIFGLAAVTIFYRVASDPAFPRWRRVQVPWGYIAISISVALLWACVMLWLGETADKINWLKQYPLWTAIGILTELAGARHLDAFRIVLKVGLFSLVLVGGVILFQQRRYGSLGFVLCFVAIVPALIWVTGFYKPILMHRTLLPSVIGVALCIGALTMPRRRIVSSSLLAAYFIPALLNLHSYYTVFEKQDWRGTTKFVENKRGEHAATIICGSSPYWLMLFYSERKPSAVFSLLPDSEDLIFEMDEVKLRSIKLGKVRLPVSMSAQDQQRVLASQWPDITSKQSLFNTFDEIWLLDGHCFGRHAQVAVTKFRNRLITAGFTPNLHQRFYEINATQYVRHQ